MHDRSGRRASNASPSADRVLFDNPEGCRIEDCNRKRMDDIDFNVCQVHALQITGAVMAAVPRNAPSPRSRYFDPKRTPDRDTSVVYYVRIAANIKIGYSANLRQRLSSFRSASNIVKVLATEPGGYNLEYKQHERFRADRIGRSELFRPSPALVEYVDALRASAGEDPIIPWWS